MNRKILVSLSIISAVAAIVIGGTIAYFSDVEKSEGNTLTAGTIDISVDDQNPWTKTYSDVLADMKPSEWRDYYYQIQNVGTNPVDIWKRITVTTTTTGILTEPECSEQGGTWDEAQKTCTFPSGVQDNNAIDTVTTYDLYVQTAAFDAGWVLSRQTAIMDLGKQISKGDLIIDYASGSGDGCRDTLTVEVSSDGENWTQVYTTSTMSVDTCPEDENEQCWKVYREKLHGIENFQYVRMTIPNCYADYAAVYALEPITNNVKVSDVNSCWIYLGRLKPGEKMFVEQRYQLQPDVTNWAQGDEMKFDIELLAQQLNAPTPTPICRGLGI